MDAKRKIFKAFYDAKKESLYFNEIKDLTGLSNSSLQNATKNMIKENILGFQKTKANVFFAVADKKRFAVEFALIDLSRLDGLNRNVRFPLKEFTGKLPLNIACVLLFGSSARKAETEKSDIDLLVVLHNFSNQKVQHAYELESIQKIEGLAKEVQARTTHNISLAFTNTQLLKEGKDHLIIQAKDTGFSISNQQLYYEALR